MARITVEDCLKSINNRFVLVHMANKRTRQLLKGSEFLLDATDNRHIVNSLREVADGKVFLDEETKENLKGGGFLDTSED